MSTTIITKALPFLFLWTLMGCGDSPLLNKSKDGVNAKGQAPLASNTLVFTSHNYTLTAFWQIGPGVFDTNTLLFFITNSEGERTSPEEEVFVYLWMPGEGMDHGSFPTKVKELSPGVFEVSDVFFTMGGYWDVHIQLKQNEQVIDEVKWGITL